MAEVAVRKSDSFLDQLRDVEDQIMQRAYNIFLGKGATAGKALDDWLEAENELFSKPAIQLIEKGNQFEVQIAVAGIDAKDVQVEVTADDLLVKGETRTEKKEEKGTVHTSEIKSGSLFRSIHFPKKVDANQVKADIKNGLLTVTAPIAEETKARKVSVTAA